MKKLMFVFTILVAMVLGGCQEELTEVLNDNLDRENIVDTLEKQVDQVIEGFNNESKNDEVVEETVKETDNRVTDFETSGTTNRIPVGLERAVDGDTWHFKVIEETNEKERLGNVGERLTVRFLLIDTPESKHPKIGYQPYGKEASDFTQAMIENANKVEIEFDIGQRQDHYGRFLAYVWADDVLVNEAIVREGLAVKAYVKPPNTRYLDEIEKAQEAAKKEKKNIWSLEDYVQGDDFKGGSKIDNNESYPEFQNNEASAAKESTASSSSNSSQKTETFANCTELKKVYPNGVKKGHPAYQEKMDRDKDGVACQ